MRVTACLLVGLASFPGAWQGRVAPADDIAVYEAILAHTIRPEVDRASAGAHISTPAPILAFDRTVMVCRPTASYSRRMGCVSDEDLRAVEDGSEKFGRPVFDRLLTPAGRTELVHAFRSRNRDERPFAGATIQGLILVPPDQLDAALQREAGRTRGYAGFSQPAFTDDGHALVYASYVCGGLCGSGWFFLLQRQGTEWKVLDAAMMWIS